MTDSLALIVPRVPKGSEYERSFLFPDFIAIVYRKRPTKAGKSYRMYVRIFFPEAQYDKEEDLDLVLKVKGVKKPEKATIVALKELKLEEVVPCT